MFAPMRRYPILCAAAVLASLMGCSASGSDDPMGGDGSTPTGDGSTVPFDGSGPSPDGDIADAGGIADATIDLGDAATHPMNPLGPGVSTLAGYSEPGFVDGPREVALFANPVNVAMGPNGDLYLCDFDNSAIRVITPNGTVSTLTQQADFIRPFGITFTPSGQLYVQTDRSATGAPSGALWRIDLDTGVANLVVDAVGRTRGLASLSDGRLVLVDYLSHHVRLYAPGENLMIPVAGQPGTAGFANGTGTSARFNVPYDVVVTPDSRLIVADHLNNRIRQVTLAGAVTTLAGTGQAASIDGAIGIGSVFQPKALALGPDGVIYISETGSSRIRTLTADGTLGTLAGSSSGYADALVLTEAQFFAAEGLDLAGDWLFVADGNGGSTDPYHRVRRVELPSAP